MRNNNNKTNRFFTYKVDFFQPTSKVLISSTLESVHKPKICKMEEGEIVYLIYICPSFNDSISFFFEIIPKRKQCPFVLCSVRNSYIIVLRAKIPDSTLSLSCPIDRKGMIEKRIKKYYML